MSNMSYCRFQNTSSDLRDCQRAIENLLRGEGKLSARELDAAKTLALTCSQIVDRLTEAAQDEAMDIEDGDGTFLDDILDLTNSNASDES